MKLAKKWIFLAAGGVIPFAVDRCERCAFVDDGPLRFTRAPRGIVEFAMPVPWQIDDSDLASSHQEDDTSYHLICRRARGEGDGFLAAWQAVFRRKFSVEAWREGPISPGKWLLTIPRNGEAMQRAMLRTATEEEWQQGIPMERSAAEWAWPPPFQVSEQGDAVHLLDRNGARRRGKDFFPTIGAMRGPPGLSAGQRWITVTGISGWFSRGTGEAWSIDIDAMVFNPPRYFSVSTFDCDSGKLVSEIRGWSCLSVLNLKGEPTWYGDDLMMIYLDPTRALAWRPPERRD